MTAADTRERLTVQDVALLRELVHWRRANGWVWGYYPGRGETRWQLGRSAVVEFDIDRRQLTLELGIDRGCTTMWPRSFREAVDVLAALGVIPARFSSAYLAGREAALIGDLLDRLEQLETLLVLAQTWRAAETSDQELLSAEESALAQYVDGLPDGPAAPGPTHRRRVWIERFIELSAEAYDARGETLEARIVRTVGRHILEGIK